MGENSSHLLPIIIVDDEEDILETEALLLSINGYTNVTTCSDSRNAFAIIDEHKQGLVILDITMPYVGGIEILSYITQNYPQIITLMLTGHNDVETAVDCMKKGAFDYIVKPVDQAKFITRIKKALEHHNIKSEAENLGHHLLQGTLNEPEIFKNIITTDKKIENMFRYIEAVAPSGLPILITGETGVGKELFAQAIHQASKLPGEFICVNTAGIDDTLFSDTLFGHDPGAFTGAQKKRRGLVEKASHGTLFLDEIGDMPQESQAKLLRLLQEGTYYTLGSEEEKHSTSRVVAATNKNIDELYNHQGFRRDLYFRLKSHHLAIPPLRERGHDITRLTDHFLAQAAEKQRKKISQIPKELYIILANYSFPGNVRELQGMINDAVSMHISGTLSCESFKEKIRMTKFSLKSPITAGETIQDTIIFPGILPTAKEVERALIEESLKRTQGNKKLASEMIGMARQTFRNKIKEMVSDEQLLQIGPG